MQYLNCPIIICEKIGHLNLIILNFTLCNILIYSEFSQDSQSKFVPLTHQSIQSLMICVEHNLQAIQYMRKLMSGFSGK